MAISTPFEEIQGSPQEGRTPEGGFVATRRLKVAWASRNTLAQEIFGTYENAVYPYQDGALAFACGSVPLPGKVKAGAGGNNKISYDWAILTIKYSSIFLEFDPQHPRPWFRETIQPAQEFVTDAPDDLRWGSADGDPVLEGEAPSRIVAGCDFIIEQFNVFSPPSLCLSLVNCSNNASVASRVIGYSFAIETLRFNMPTIMRDVDVTGAQTFRIIHRWSYRYPGWNWFWRPKANDWVRQYSKDGSIYKPYTPADFSGAL